MEKIIISLGGSLIIPDSIDIDFLKDFRELIISEVEKGRKFVIITGGGKICRRYQDAGKEIKRMSEEDLDWLGIYTTRYNAEFMKILFGELAEEKIILDPTIFFEFKKPIVLGGGYKPGNSSDLATVVIAKNIGVKRIINLSNIDFVYDSDPKLNKSAKRIEKISWAEYRKIIPKEWNPGLNSPFDPIASETAEMEGIEVVIMNGKPIDNLRNCILGKKFNGTIIN
ncbi:MAG: UMP kinase [Candidatus Paceibacterota bacterium]|jgi:uridylate kinase